MNNKKPILIKCPIHGDFLQRPDSHLQGKGCRLCGIEKNSLRLTSNTEEFITKSNKIHKDRYDYSKVEYKNNRTKVCIICPQHGYFWQTPNIHLRGNGCSKCAGKYHYTTEEWIEEAKKVHKGNKYDYTNVAYTDAHTKISIICKKNMENFCNSHMSI